MHNYAGIIVNNESVQLDRIFTYKVPEELKNDIQVGYRVKVPFGNGNKKIDGYIIEFYENIPFMQNIKEIIEICDSFSVLRKQDILLIKWMKEKYLATYLECIKVFIPTGIVKGLSHKISERIQLGEPLNEKYNKEPYLKIFDYVKQNEGVYNKSELFKNQSFSISSMNTMIKHGFLISSPFIVNRYNEKNYKSYDTKILNQFQEKTVNEILQNKNNKFLIHGITGSGKTEIYMHLVKNMMENDLSSIILVPEISLTPQMVERFKGRFGKDISVFHSKLSEGERYDEWIRIKEGKVKIAIGARSALFLPFENLGLIVIDEEHENSYKSESDPKYTAKEVAEMKCELENCKVVFGSATPSMETYNRALQGEIKLISITERVDGAVLPEIKIVDMREELLTNNKSIFSKELYHDIKEKLQRKEQIMLFLNRRGFSTFVSCRKCGYVFKCKNCDVSLTYHMNENLLTCHYCGIKQKIQNTCPKCGSTYVKYFGIGTEKVEQEIKKIFPNAKTLRMDFDTTRKKDSHETIYNTFKDKKADILIGTQMIAKGLDFEDVTLVGIIAADLSLNLPDFRSGERTFQLITQVAGRAGRGKKNGKVLIQTYNPEHYSIKYAAANDYINFYKEELGIRETMSYPPFSQLLCLNFTSKNEALLIKNIQIIAIKLNSIIANNDKINMLGPCPCGVNKIKEQYRWQIIFKGDLTISITKSIKDETYELLKKLYNEIKVSMDINPNNLL